MGTRVGIITEGPIDDILLPALLERIAWDRADFTWPVVPDDLAEIIPLRKRGHGGVLQAVKRLVEYYDGSPPTDYALFVILLDRRTRPVQRQVRKAISGRPRFVLGIAIEEIEAWWLADRRNTLAWLGLPDEFRGGMRYWATGYNPERDPRPKNTLDALTLIAPRLDQRYGDGNTELAREFADDHWQAHAELDAIEAACPRGFRPFCRDATQAMRRERAREGRLLW